MIKTINSFLKKLEIFLFPIVFKMEQGLSIKREIDILVLLISYSLKKPKKALLLEGKTLFTT